MSDYNETQFMIPQRSTAEPQAASGVGQISVREACLDVMRRFGITKIFGNPGSTELPMLRDFPADFSYVLGLQEAVVIGMADGYQTRPGHHRTGQCENAPAASASWLRCRQSGTQGLR